MKNLMIILFFVNLFLNSNAQQSSFKVGGNFNTDYVSHKSGNISYESWEASYERGLGKKFSINATFNYAKRDYTSSTNIEFYPVYPPYSDIYIDYDQSLIIEGRYYIKSNNSGIFFSAGIPITYTTETGYSQFSSILVKHSQNEYYFSISTIAGFGIKYPFSKSFGVEMSMNYSPSLNLLGTDYGTSGFIKSGIKFFYSLNKVKPATQEKL